MAFVALIVIFAGFLLLLMVVVSVIRPYRIGRFKSFRSRKAILISAPAIIAGTIISVGMLSAIDGAFSRTTGSREADVVQTESPVEAVVASMPSLRDADSCVQAVQMANGVLSVECYIMAGWDHKGLVDEAGRVAEAIGEDLQSGVGEGSGVNFVLITYSTDTTDRSGHESMDNYLSVRFPAADIRAAKFENLRNSRVLNLADAVSVPPAGVKSLSAWCANNEEGGAAFCAKAGY